MSNSENEHDDNLRRHGGWMSYDEAIETIVSWVQQMDDPEAIARIFSEVTGAKIKSHVDNGIQFEIPGEI